MLKRLIESNNLSLFPDKVKLVSFVAFMSLILGSQTNAAITVYIEEANGGSQLKMTVDGYLDTASLGAPTTNSTNNTSVLFSYPNGWLWIASTPNQSTNFWNLFVESDSTLGGINLSPLYALSLETGNGEIFATHPILNVLFVSNNYISGERVHYTATENGSYASQGINPGSTETRSWNGGGAGNSITFVAGSPTSVPEPNTMLLTLCPALLYLFRRRRFL